MASPGGRSTIPAARARIPSVTLSAMKTAGPPGWSASSERRRVPSGTRAGIRNDPPGGVDRGADLVRLPLHQRSRRHQRDGLGTIGPWSFPQRALTPAPLGRAGRRGDEGRPDARGVERPAHDGQRARHAAGFRHDRQQTLALAEDVVTEEAPPLLALAGEAAFGERVRPGRGAQRREVDLRQHVGAGRRQVPEIAVVGGAARTGFCGRRRGRLLLHEIGAARPASKVANAATTTAAADERTRTRLHRGLESRR